MNLSLKKTQPPVSHNNLKREQENLCATVYKALATIISEKASYQHIVKTDVASDKDNQVHKYKIINISSYDATFIDAKYSKKYL